MSSPAGRAHVFIVTHQEPYGAQEIWGVYDDLDVAKEQTLALRRQHFDGIDRDYQETRVQQWWGSRLIAIWVYIPVASPQWEQIPIPATGPVVDAGSDAAVELS
ncbi:Uncharacterised protein [Mycobacteroides abscessus subsp. abscessus]|uniref:hypothetical protein n=1 Tax=Mycobacteroides abscessus TaxID=36809 RepID=UPI0009285EEE|nr:hypothetical protein [Mycobacteroides abscessus]SHU66908.1 Uncharacterised protein [Mycobacteroides abscessus subsp. abscessus]